MTANTSRVEELRGKLKTVSKMRQCLLGRNAMQTAQTALEIARDSLEREICHLTRKGE